MTPPAFRRNTAQVRGNFSTHVSEMWPSWLSRQLPVSSKHESHIIMKTLQFLLTLPHLFCHLPPFQCLRAVCWTPRAAWGERQGEEGRAEGEESPWRGTRARSLSWGCSSRGSCRGTGPASRRSRSRLWRKVRPLQARTALCFSANHCPPWARPECVMTQLILLFFSPANTFMAEDWNIRNHKRAHKKIRLILCLTFDLKTCQTVAPVKSSRCKLYRIFISANIPHLLQKASGSSLDNASLLWLYYAARCGPRSPDIRWEGSESHPWLDMAAAGPWAK